MNRRKFEEVERVTVLKDGSRGEIRAWNGLWATVALDEGGTVVVHAEDIKRDGQPTGSP